MVKKIHQTAIWIAVVSAMAPLHGAWAQATPEGCWLGTVGEGPALRRAVFQLSRLDAGEWRGMTHLFTNRVQAHEMTDMVIDGRLLGFAMADVDGEPRFKGELSGSGIRGTFTRQGREMPVRMSRVGGPDADGLALVDTWTGWLEQDGTPVMRIVVRITQVACGQIAATIDSPDQGAENMPVTHLAARDDSLRFAMTYLNGEYAGRVNAEGGLEGTWTQNGVEMTLNLERADSVLPTQRRPQEPREPYPYDEEEVTYVSASGDVTLAGTLTTPKGAGPFPAVLMLTGSGAQDRDESFFGHRPFLVIADHLTGRGIAVLRVDDRGVGGSSGSTLGSTLLDSAEDALAGVAFLKSRPRIDAARIGLVGHSEGGWVAPIVVTRSSDVAFIVLLAGPGVSGEELLIAQGVELNLAAGSSREFAEAASEVAKRLYDVLRNEADNAAATAKLLDVAKASRRELLDASTSATDTLLTVQWIDSFDQQTDILTTAWFRYLLTFDPRPTLQHVRVPVLALFGQLDLQVPQSQNKPALERALASAGNTDVTVHVLQELNHMFQTAKTGRMDEYGRLDETISPRALAIISDWILGRAR